MAANGSAPVTGGNGSDTEWMGTAAIARALGCTKLMVQRRLQDPAEANRLFGVGNWRDRDHLLSRRKVYRVRRFAVMQLASGTEIDESPVPPVP